MVCARNPFEALEVLARRASSAAVSRVQTWRHAIGERDE
jgi:hypothetical protein